ncbi:MAG TPA: NUDIX domain-containing protein [Polyangiaceae bacterium]
MPPIGIRVARDRTAQSRAEGGFMNVRRMDLVAEYPDGSTSEPFAYDVVERKAIDAVAVVAFARAEGAEAQVFLRSAARVPLILRDGFGVEEGNLWELPAGLIDPGETPREAAAREIEEELGFKVRAAELRELGGWVWPVPGFIAERHFYFCVDVTGHARGTPTEDGSALERGASIQSFPLGELLAHCRAGDVHDAKTELALRRFAELA